MSDWKPIYIVGDGKNKKSSNVPAKSPPAQPPKPVPSKRRGIRRPWVWSFMFISFMAGLYLGLKEDFQIEEFLSMEVAEDMWLQDGAPKKAAFSLGQSRQGRSAPHEWVSYRLVHSDHFIKRLNCRGVKISEVEKALAFGSISMFDPDSKDRGKVIPKFNIEYTNARGRTLLVSFNVFPRNESIKLITTYYKGELDNCD